MATSTKTPSAPAPKPGDDPCAITAARLMACCPLLKPEAAEIHAAALEAARAIAELNTSRRVRHFLAQCAHETGGFRRLVESLVYRDPVRLDSLFSAVRDVQHARALIAGGEQAIANCVYANRCGNGDARSFDGWTYRGRGYLQVTGRANYRKIGTEVGLPLEGQPELLGEPKSAAIAAATYWRLHGINTAADADNVRYVTQRINPALAGLDDRIAWNGAFRAIYP